MQKEKTDVSKKKIAYDGIKKMILDGFFSKDEALVERQLCEKLNVSRTPVREALRELANDEIVEIVEGKGVFVKRLGFRDMIEIFELRETLEKMAVRLFIERMDNASLELLEKYVHKQEKAYEEDNHEEFMDYDMKIHNLISEGAKNRRLSNMINSIYDQITLMAVSAKDDSQLRDQAIQSHRLILKAIMDRDIPAAETAMVEHVVNIKKYHMDRYYLL